MAGQHLRRRVHYSDVKYLRTLTIYLLATAEDEDDKFVGVVIAQLAYKEQQKPKRNGKYGPRGCYNNAKSTDFLTCCLIHSQRGSLKTSADTSGVKVYRVNHETFWHLHSLIKSDPIFASTRQRPQRPVQYQLAAFMCHAGGAVSGVKLASAICIAEGTVYDYAKRVCQAFHNIWSDYLAWPGVDRRAWLSKQMGAEGFQDALALEMAHISEWLTNLWSTPGHTGLVKKIMR
ncbi:hypothetical protein FIBSPDRAFT_887199 [Athelia psychrophila]|uniref:DDE Tnp4 domain-containing protein n=1 Tax=Athelia psychrophila TaxID=1759441 RepID=A0A166Q3H0_9AGAM|nr:hypothetical protein FIBSPDRAFT_887199 [Fibularhizoctonia sp. CBS 109695]